MNSALSRDAQLLRQLLILVASDKKPILNAAADILAHAGHRFMTAGDGDRALDALEANEFDLVLLDVNLPVTNGIEVAKLYRFLSLDRPYVPIVAIVDAATGEKDRRLKDAGIDASIAAPIEPQRLLEVVRALVQGDRPKQRAVPDAGSGAGQRKASTAAVDVGVLGALERLGGRDFADRLAAQFLEDAPELLRDFAAAVASGSPAVSSQLHILRNASANIGARSISDLCSVWSRKAPEMLANMGARELETLSGEFSRVCAALRDRLSACNGPIECSAGDRQPLRPAFSA
jgi:two-component system sensor histidine kinase RpfC